LYLSGYLQSRIFRLSNNPSWIPDLNNETLLCGGGILTVGTPIPISNPLGTQALEGDGRVSLGALPHTPPHKLTTKSQTTIEFFRKFSRILIRLWSAGNPCHGWGISKHAHTPFNLVGFHVQPHGADGEERGALQDVASRGVPRDPGRRLPQQLVRPAGPAS